MKVINWTCQECEREIEVPVPEVGIDVDQAFAEIIVLLQPYLRLNSRREENPMPKVRGILKRLKDEIRTNETP